MKSAHYFLSNPAHRLTHRQTERAITHTALLIVTAQVMTTASSVKQCKAVTASSGSVSFARSPHQSSQSSRLFGSAVVTLTLFTTLGDQMGFREAKMFDFLARHLEAPGPGGIASKLRKEAWEVMADHHAKYHGDRSLCVDEKSANLISKL